MILFQKIALEQSLIKKLAAFKDHLDKKQLFYLQIRKVLNHNKVLSKKIFLIYFCKKKVFIRDAMLKKLTDKQCLIIWKIGKSALKPGLQ